jgi:hypothetical protein
LVGSAIDCLVIALLQFFCSFLDLKPCNI